MALPHVILVHGVAVYYFVKKASLADIGQAGQLAREAGIPASCIRLTGTDSPVPAYFVQSPSGGECYIITFPRAQEDNLGVRTMNTAARLVARYHV